MTTPIPPRQVLVQLVQSGNPRVSLTSLPPGQAEPGALFQALGRWWRLRAVDLERGTGEARPAAER